VNTPPFTEQFSVETNMTQLPNFNSEGNAVNIILNWTAAQQNGDYIQTSNLDLTSGTYIPPITAYYHVFATISLNYNPLVGAASYNVQNTPMTLRFNLQEEAPGSNALLSASFFGYSYAGVGGPGNNNGILTYDTATLSGDVLLQVGNIYWLEIVNPFIDDTPVFLMTGENGIFGAYTRWSMCQFASDF
jgi:hypothetical protein